MARVSRLVLAGVAHHVVARGVNKQAIFANGYDKGRYLKRFARVADEEKVQVHGYCLMPNHVHWILTPSTPNGLARLFARVHTWWAMYFNKRRNRSGHLFQSRYHSSPMDEAHYWTALRYVELNPKRANLVGHPQNWLWSSARCHVHGQEDRMVTIVPAVTRRRMDASQWREFLEEGSPEQDLALRRAGRGSRPCGAGEWIRALEEQTDRKLAWSPPRVAPKDERRWLAA